MSKRDAKKKRKKPKISLRSERREDMSRLTITSTFFDKNGKLCSLVIEESKFDI